MKKVIKLIVLGFEMLADGGAAIITKPSKENPSENGVHKINQGQLRRICLRTLGVYNPIALKHLISVSNGGAILNIDAEDCKQGDAYENKSTGEKGTYTKDWTKYSNHEVKLGFAATMKLAEMSLASSFANEVATYDQPIAPRAKVEEVVGEKKDEPTV